MKHLLISAVIGALLGAFITYRLMPPRTEIVTKNHDVVHTQIQEKIITKTVKEPSGVVTIVEERVKVVEKQAEKIQVSNRTQTFPSDKGVPQYRGTLSFSPTFEFKGAGVERRLVGPIWGGVSATRDREILFSLAWEF
jgi:hypothetical protein